ncbi:MAG: hypothetical protein ACUZ77_00290 [Candidatus Brocadiales bacterium]
MPDDTIQNQTAANKNKTLYLVILGVVFLILVVIVVFFRVTTTEPTITPVSQPQAAIEIKSDADLKKLEDEVGNVNIDDLSKDLDLNDQDASQF